MVSLGGKELMLCEQNLIVNSWKTKTNCTHHACFMNNTTLDGFTCTYVVLWLLSVILVFVYLWCVFMHHVRCA